MNASVGGRPRPLRLVLVALLVVAALLNALPWLGCGQVLGDINFSILFGACTFGDTGAQFRPGLGLPGFTGPYWGNLLMGAVYLASALFVGLTKRPL